VTGMCLVVCVVLIGCTILSLVVALDTGCLAWYEIFLAIGGNTTINGQEISGVMGMYDITVISIIVACIVSLVKEYGGIHFILQWIHRRIKGEKGAELGIAGLALLVDACTANNTVAIVMAGNIANEISEEYGVSARRSASLLDIFTSVGQCIIPYGAQLLSAASLTALSPYDIIPY